MKHLLDQLQLEKLTDEGYPVLQLTSGKITLYKSVNGLSNAVFKLNKKGSFSARYNKNEIETEKYRVLSGTIEMETMGVLRTLLVGETIDASLFEHAITFFARTDAEILLLMDEKKYKEIFFEMKALEKLMDAVIEIDGYTYHHCDRIRKYAIEVWKYFQLPGENLKTMRWGAYFHDIGKLAIPLEILNKPGSLTPEEWEVMKTHSVKGAEIIRAHDLEWLRKAAFIIEQHHERYDGKGYPFGLKGDEISMEAAIISVVDAFDAMTTDRIYQPALSIPYAIQELVNCKGTQFNPEVVDAFIEVLNRINFDWE